MGGKIKELRNQLRNVVKDLLPEILTQALVQKVRDEIVVSLRPQLAKLEKDVKTSLEAIDARSKQSMGFVVRQAAGIALPQAGETVPEIKKEEGKKNVGQKET